MDPVSEVCFQNRDVFCGLKYQLIYIHQENFQLEWVATKSVLEMIKGGMDLTDELKHDADNEKLDETKNTRKVFLRLMLTTSQHSSMHEIANLRKNPMSTKNSALWTSTSVIHRVTFTCRRTSMITSLRKRNKVNVKKLLSNEEKVIFLKWKKIDFFPGERFQIQPYMVDIEWFLSLHYNF